MLGSPVSRRLPRLRQLASYFRPRRGGCLRHIRRRWAGEERLSAICSYRRPQRHPRGLWRSGRLRIIAGGWLGEESAGLRLTIRVLTICVYRPRRHLDPRHRCTRRGAGAGRRSGARVAELRASELSRLRASKTTKFEGSSAADKELRRLEAPTRRRARPTMRVPLFFRAAGENRQLGIGCYGAIFRV